MLKITKNILTHTHIPSFIVTRLRPEKVRQDGVDPPDSVTLYQTKSIKELTQLRGMSLVAFTISIVGLPDTSRD